MNDADKMKEVARHLTKAIRGLKNEIKQSPELTEELSPILSKIEEVKEEYKGKIYARKRAEIEHNKTLYGRRNDYKKRI